MGEFWNSINKFRTRRIKKGGNIKKKDWDAHFKKLLGASEGVEAEKDQDTVGETEKGEEESINKEITIEKVRKAMMRMKNNKAAGY